MEIYDGQVGAIIKRVGANTNDALWDDYLPEARAVEKRICSDIDNGVGKGDIRQPGTITKNKISDAVDVIGDVKTGQLHP